MESGYTVLEVKYDTGMARIYDHISNESRYISISTVKQLYKSGVLVNGVVEDSIGRIRLSPVCSAEDLDTMDNLAKELYTVIPVNKE